MAKRGSEPVQLLRWTKHVPASDVQDPLGTNLRGSTRLASRLLYCLTSITPRGRYFSFVPWCVLDFQRREKGRASSPGLGMAMAFREHALTLGCIAHHDGEACEGGALVGSLKAIKWFENRRGDDVDFRRTNFVKIPAYRAYFNSLVNLGAFVTDDELPDDEEEQESERTLDDIQLSPLGLEIAERYDAAVGNLTAVKQISAPERRCTIPALKQLGLRGGLCELSAPSAPERDLLRDVFFRRRELKGDAHATRRQSLLLLLELCKSLSALGVSFDRYSFADAVYFGEVSTDDEKIVAVTLPPCLNDISLRWRMFYFHFYMGTALEGMFAWLVTELAGAGLTGRTLEQVVARFAEKSVRADLTELLRFDIGRSLTDLSPARLLTSTGVPAGPLDPEKSSTLDAVIRLNSPLAEPKLELPLREGTHLGSASGLAIPLVLLSVTLGRYKRWERTDYGNWLASVARDPYVDLIPPVVLDGLSRRLGDWWQTPFDQLAGAVLSRYVIQQHQSMAFEKTAAGDRCLIQVDGPRLCGTGGYDRIGIVNARFRSAVQVLADLGLMREDEEERYVLTGEGERFLAAELACEGVP